MDRLSDEMMALSVMAATTEQWPPPLLKPVSSEQSLD